MRADKEIVLKMLRERENMGLMNQMGVKVVDVGDGWLKAKVYNSIPPTSLSHLPLALTLTSPSHFHTADGSTRQAYGRKWICSCCCYYFTCWYVRREKERKRGVAREEREGRGVRGE